MRRLIAAVLFGVLAGLFGVAGVAGAQEVYVQAPGNTPTVTPTDTGGGPSGGTSTASPSGTSGSAPDTEGTRVLGVQVSRGEDERLMFAATGADLIGLLLIGAALVGMGYYLRRRSVAGTAQTA